MTSPKPTTYLSRLRRGGIAGAMASTVAILAACAQSTSVPAAGQEPLVISQSTNDSLQEYLAKIRPNMRGVFAVSPDGANSYYVYCPDISCNPPLYGGIAKTQCYSLSGQECMLLYVWDEPRRAYTVNSQQTPVGRHGHRRARPLDEMPIFNRN